MFIKPALFGLIAIVVGVLLSILVRRNLLRISGFVCSIGICAIAAFSLLTTNISMTLKFVLFVAGIAFAVVVVFRLLSFTKTYRSSKRNSLVVVMAGCVVALSLGLALSAGALSLYVLCEVHLKLWTATKYEELVGWWALALPIVAFPFYLAILLSHDSRTKANS